MFSCMLGLERKEEKERGQKINFYKKIDYFLKQNQNEFFKVNI